MAIQVMYYLPVGAVTIFFHQFSYTCAAVKSVIIKHNNPSRYQFVPNPFQNIFGRIIYIYIYMTKAKMLSCRNLICGILGKDSSQNLIMGVVTLVL